MTDFFPSITPYNYVGNNPISFTDPDGLSRATRIRKRLMRKRKRILKNKGGKRKTRKKNSGYGTPKAGTQLPGSGGYPQGPFLAMRPPVPAFIPSLNLDFGDDDWEIEEDLEIVNSPVRKKRKEDDPFAYTNLKFTGQVFKKYTYEIITDNKKLHDFLKPIAEYLKANKGVKIQIVISTDAPEDQMFTPIRMNAGLAVNWRANELKGYMKSKYGIPGSQVVINSDLNETSNGRGKEVRISKVK